MGGGPHGESHGAREQDADVDEVVEALQQRRGVREEVDLIEEERTKPVVPPQLLDQLPEGVLPEEHGLPGSPRADDSGEVPALLARQRGVQEAPAFVGPTLLLREVVELQGSLKCHGTISTF